MTLKGTFVLVSQFAQSTGEGSAAFVLHVINKLAFLFERVITLAALESL